MAGRVLLEADEHGAASRITGNQALRGGAVLLCGLNTNDGLAALRAVDARFEGNGALESGGAIAAFRLALIDLRGCNLSTNTVTAEHGEGGAVHATVGCRVRLENTEVSYNTASFRGGALSICNSSLRILDGCALRYNDAENGDCGGMAFYTMPSTFLDDLLDHPRLEMPLVCAIAPCPIEHNRAHKGIAGLFLGSFQKEASYRATFSLKSPALVRDNELTRSRHGRPEQLVVLWKGKVVGDENRPPRGRRNLV